jgi:lysozyme family protein
MGVATGWLLAGLLYSLRFDGAAQVIVAVAVVVLGVGTVGLMYFSRRQVKLTVQAID